VALRQEEFTSLCDDVDLDRDRALVERCQAGDSAAFGNLYARYYERLLRFCQRRLNDRHEAEDAAQEAFARAWKALPNFAGERRFYPWLTVIAGNICTDMLRRRSRSTPTDDFELSAQQPVGASSFDTSEELVIAAVDGELVNKALGRLSVRHRHVLAMREGSGWTYQQIADYEGVEIGTIETLLWRARQALKREFNVLSESKGVLSGFLVGTGALIRRGVMRVANRGAVIQQNSGLGAGGLRNAFAGVAVTSAAVAAAFIAPHVLSSSRPAQQSALSAPSGVGLADPQLPLGAATTAVAAAASTSTESGGGTAANGSGGGTGGGNADSSSLKAASGSTTHGAQGAFPTVKAASNSPVPLIPSGLPGSTELAPVVGGLTQATTSLENAVNGLTTTLGLGDVLTQIGLAPASGSGSSAASTTTTSTTLPVIGGLTNTVHSTLKKLLEPES
jgi:RNA polymerase sigma-70 factor (ECF subfamily)